VGVAAKDVYSYQHWKASPRVGLTRMATEVAPQPAPPYVEPGRRAPCPARGL